MVLGKWSSNHRDVLTGITDDLSKEISLQSNEVVSTLGIKWIPQKDEFIMTVKLPALKDDVTKRIILSEISRLFDPLGWITPIIIVAKVILQDLWLQKLDWDTVIQGELRDRWIQFRTSLDCQPNLIAIPRWIGCSTTSSWHLHGFSDASKRVYAAVLYAVIPSSSATLLMAKTKLAPTSTQTVPRLELCGATLLIRLASHVVSKLHRPPDKVFFWTDSRIVLDWLKGHPSRWTTFVANRVSQITTAFPNAVWQHVVSAENAADCATRGMTPQQLVAHRLWWSGPTWIQKDQGDWPSSEMSVNEVQALHTVEVDQRMDNSLIVYLEKISSFNKIRRILSRLAKWRLKLKKPVSMDETAKEDSTSLDSSQDYLSSSGEVTAQEWSLALVYYYKLIQIRHYPKELETLQKKNSEIYKRSPLSRLSPFLDKQGLIRVGGRLEYAPIPFSEQHPVILPGNELLVKRLVEHAHIVTMHGGVQIMLSYLHRMVWITGAHRLAVKIFRTCVKCIRHKQQTKTQQMAPLPSTRLTPQRPFAVAGLDYAGPVPILFSKGRGAKSTKGYIAIFICFVTKAVHIEVVSDLTTDAFLAAYARFCARRGVCTVLHSDNATTFKGAAKELDRMFHEATEFSQQVKGQLAMQGTHWSFIPPRAPHFGGLWEAAVRSFKNHFVKAIGNSTFTFEELYTLVTRIEACLNSRPLCPLTTDSSELATLTPGHFLMGCSTLAPPEAIDLTEKLSLKNRWTLICQLRNSFWDRWKREVLHHFQQRHKWLKQQPDLQIGDFVIIKDELTPPTTWPLALVTTVHPGKDSKVRTVTLKTADSIFIRPIVKLIKLPIDEKAEENYQYFINQESASK